MGRSEVVPLASCSVCKSNESRVCVADIIMKTTTVLVGIDPMKDKVNLLRC